MMRVLPSLLAVEAMRGGATPMEAAYQVVRLLAVEAMRGGVTPMDAAHQVDIDVDN